MDEFKKQQLNYEPNINYTEDYYSQKADSSLLTTASSVSTSTIPSIINSIDNALKGLPNNLSKAISEVYDPVKDFYYNYLYDKVIDFDIPNYQDEEIINVPTDNDNNLANIYLDKKVITLKVGQTYQLKYSIIPANHKIKGVEWTSKDSNIATVLDGLVTAKTVGTCYVSVKIIGENSSARCKVMVVDEYGQGSDTPSEKDVAKRIYLDKRVLVIGIGEHKSLSYHIIPSNAHIDGVEWKSDNEEIAVVDNGVVTGIKKGNCEVIVKIKNENKMARCKIIVISRSTSEDTPDIPDTPIDTDILVRRVELTNSYIDMYVGDTFQLGATVYPYNATNKEIAWKSTNKKIATVVNGLVTGVSVGQCRVIVSTIEGNKKDTCYVTVLEKTTPINPDDDRNTNGEGHLPSIPDDDNDNTKYPSDDENKLWEHSDFPIFKVTQNDDRDIVIKQFEKNAYDLINYYLNQLNEVLSTYYYQTLKLTTNLKNDDIKWLFDDISETEIDIENINTQTQHLLDTGLRHFRISNVKMNYLENSFNIIQTVQHFQNFLAMYELKKRYINIQYFKGDNIKDAESNMILKGASRDYELKYDKTYTNLFRYLNSSLKITADVINTIIQGYKSKELLIMKGGNK